MAKPDSLFVRKSKTHKILILSLLLFLVPASGQAYDKYFYQNIIRAYGWKCNEVRFASEARSSINRSLSVEIKCENGKVYYFTNRPLKNEERSMAICHKGVCKKLK